MARFLKTKKENIGLPPDAIQLIGEKKSDYIRLRLFDFDADHIEEREVKNVKEVTPFEKQNTTSWFNIDGLHDDNIMQEIARSFDLSSYIISDIMDTHARPKIYEYDNCVYISLKMLQYNETDNYVSSENLVLVLKENLLLSFQERAGDVFEPIRERLRKNKKRIRSSGGDFLAFSILDVVIDHYIYIISRIGEKIEDLDEELINNPSTAMLEEINNLKGEINFLRKTIKPCRELILSLVKMDSELLKENTFIYLKELQDNVKLADESTDSYREMLTDQLNIFHSVVSNKLNDILKFLTIFSVIFIPLTFIAGVYGTNFDYLPELGYKYSYFIMWGLMIIIAGTMILFFKKKKWF